jgi:hypothetical protein
MARTRTTKVDAFDAVVMLRKSIKIAATDLTRDEFTQAMAQANDYAESPAVFEMSIDDSAE